VSRFYLAIPDAFTEVECDAVIALAGEARLAPAPVYGDAGGRIDTAVRDAGSVLIERDEAPWLFARLDALLARGGEEFGLPVGPITEQIQILRYGEGGHFGLWHTDGGADASERRLVSMSVELSALAEHEGGALELVPDLVGRPRVLERGGAHLFPSRALHRVTPVARGERWALVAWTGAPEG
jgi:PKHD-type hydroxylase